jgi:hypothetical protein
MSSGILTYASPWQNESGNENRYNSTVRKRTSTISTPTNRNNKTIKKTSSYNQESEDIDEYSTDKENFQSLSPTSLEESNARSIKVQEIINNVNSVNTENDGTSLANFNPYIEPPNPAVVKSVAPTFSTIDSSNLGNSFGSYRDIYNTNSRIGEYPYNRPDVPNTPVYDTKITEKMNYIIHLLEEQQNEPTKHITEEFILYTFLGIFVIYIVDSFARVGKYVR